MLVCVWRVHGMQKKVPGYTQYILLLYCESVMMSDGKGW